MMCQCSSLIFLISKLCFFKNTFFKFCFKKICGNEISHNACGFRLYPAFSQSFSVENGRPGGNLSKSHVKRFLNLFHLFINSFSIFNLLRFNLSLNVIFITSESESRIQ